MLSGFYPAVSKTERGIGASTASEAGARKPRANVDWIAKSRAPTAGTGVADARDAMSSWIRGISVSALFVVLAIGCGGSGAGGGPIGNGGTGAVAGGTGAGAGAGGVGNQSGGGGTS